MNEKTCANCEGNGCLMIAERPRCEACKGTGLKPTPPRRARVVALMDAAGGIVHRDGSRPISCFGFLTVLDVLRQVIREGDDVQIESRALGTAVYDQLTRELRIAGSSVKVRLVDRVEP